MNDMIFSKNWGLTINGNLDFGLEKSWKNHGTFFWDFCGNLGGCFTKVLRALQNVLSKFVYCKNLTFYENFKLKLCMCAHALGTRTKFQLEILTINEIFGIVYFREIILKSSRNVSETTPWCCITRTERLSPWQFGHCLMQNSFFCSIQQALVLIVTTLPCWPFCLLQWLYWFFSDLIELDIQCLDLMVGRSVNGLLPVCPKLPAI